MRLNISNQPTLVTYFINNRIGSTLGRYFTHESNTSQKRHLEWIRVCKKNIPKNFLRLLIESTVYKSFNTADTVISKLLK